jgi:hypothetical protein
MNYLAANYDMFRMKEKPRKMRAGLSRRGCRGMGAPRLTRLINVRRFPSFLLFRPRKKFGELHRQFPKGLWRDLSQRVARRYATRILEVTELPSFQFVLIPFLVCPNSDSTAAHQQSEPTSHQLSVLTHALRNACNHRRPIMP